MFNFVDIDGRVDGNNWKMLMSNGGGWDKVNPKEFRRVMTIPLLAAGAIAGAGISWSLGWAYTPEIIAAGKYLLTSSVNTAYRVRVFYDIELNERLGTGGKYFLSKLFPASKKIRNIDPKQFGRAIIDYGEEIIQGGIEGLTPSPPSPKDRRMIELLSWSTAVCLTTKGND